MTKPGDLVVDPFMGVGSTAVAATLRNRRAAGAEIMPDYLKVARQRVKAAWTGNLRTRPMNRPVYDPKNGLSKGVNGNGKRRMSMKNQRYNTDAEQIDWDGVEEEVVRKFRYLSHFLKATPEPLRAKIMKDLIVPNLSLLASFCANIKEDMAVEDNFVD